MERKWHEKTWIIVLLIIIFWPVGLFLFFKNPYYSKNIKMGIIGLGVAIIAFAALTSNNTPKSNDSETKIATTTQQMSEENKKQEEEKRLQKEQQERENAEKAAAEKARKEQEAAELKAQKEALEEQHRQAEAYRKEHEKIQKDLNEINSHTYTEVHINTLMNDVKTNAARANKNYKDKYFKIVGGIVKNIESEGDYVSIEAPPSSDFDLDLFNVQCYPKTDLAKEQLFQLNMNQRVTVYGKITDVGEIMGYYLELMKIE